MELESYERLELPNQKSLLIPAGWAERVAMESKATVNETFYQELRTKLNPLFYNRADKVLRYINLFGNAISAREELYVQIPERLTRLAVIGREHLEKLLEALQAPYQGRLQSAKLYATSKDLIASYLTTFGFGDTYHIIRKEDEGEENEPRELFVTVSALPKEALSALERLLNIESESD
jgi:hypothetical protein